MFIIWKKNWKIIFFNPFFKIGVPGSIDEFYNILDLEKKYSKDHPNDPLLVHCSAGLGRTGVFLLVYFALYEFEKNKEKDPEFNMFESVKKLRDQRAGMIQKPVNNWIN